MSAYGLQHKPNAMASLKGSQPSSLNKLGLSGHALGYAAESLAATLNPSLKTGWDYESNLSFTLNSSVP